MKKDKTQLQVILEALQSLGGGEYTTAEIMEAISDDQAYRFKKPREVSTILLKLKEANKVINGSTVYDNGRAKLTWISNNAISTHQPLVSAAPKAVEAEPVKVYQTEAEREYFDGFSYPKNETASIESMIEDACHTATLSIVSIFTGLIEQVEKTDYSRKEVEYLDDKLKMLDDLSRVFAGSPYSQLLAEIKEDLQA